MADANVDREQGPASLPAPDSTAQAQAGPIGPRFPRLPVRKWFKSIRGRLKRGVKTFRKIARAGTKQLRRDVKRVSPHILKNLWLKSIRDRLKRGVKTFRKIARAGTKQLGRDAKRVSSRILKNLRHPKRPTARETAEQKAIRRARRKADAHHLKQEEKKRQYQRLQSLMEPLTTTDPPPLPPDPADVKQIAVVADMGIGNLILFQPFMRALRQRFATAEIILINFKSRGTAAHALIGDWVDRHLIFPYRKEVSQEALEAVHAEMAAMDLRPDIVAARWMQDVNILYLLRATEPRYRAGFVTSGGFVGTLDCAFNVPVTMEKHQHEVERYLLLAAALGCDTSDRHIELRIGSAAHRRASAFLTETGITDRTVICIQTGSSTIQTWKRWPLENWMALAQRLQSAGLAVVFLGSEDECEEIETTLAEAGLQGASGIVNAAGTLSLLESAAVIAQARLMVGADSSLMHVAAATGTEVVALMGPTDVDRTRPWTEHCVLIQRPCRCNTGTLFDLSIQKKMAHCNAPCMAEIQVDQVADTVFSRLRCSKGEGGKASEEGRQARQTSQTDQNGHT